MDQQQPPKAGARSSPTNSSRIPIKLSYHDKIDNPSPIFCSIPAFDQNNNPVAFKNTTAFDKSKGTDPEVLLLPKVSSHCACCGARFPEKDQRHVNSVSSTSTTLNLGERTPAKPDGKHVEHYVEEVDDNTHNNLNRTSNLGGGTGVTIEEIESASDEKDAPAHGKQREGEINRSTPRYSYGHPSPIFSLFKGSMKMPVIPENSALDDTNGDNNSKLGNTSTASPSTNEQRKSQERQPSFHTDPRPVSSRCCMACFQQVETTKTKLNLPEMVNNPSRTSPVPKQNKASRLPVPRPSSKPTKTYEDIFLMKKALAEKSHSAIRTYSRDSAATPYCPPSGGGYSQKHEQKAVYTRVITKTFTEYEVDNRKPKCRGRPRARAPPPPKKKSSSAPDSDKKSNHSNSNASTRSSTPFEPSSRKKPDRVKKDVKIEEPKPRAQSDLESDKKSQKSKESIRSRNSTPGKKPSQAKSVQASPAPVEETPEKRISTSTKTTRMSKSPRVTLIGHGDPILAVPPLATPEDEPSAHPLKKQTTQEVKPCKKCRLYKHLYYRSEDTVRYLTEMLNMKEVAKASLEKVLQSIQIIQYEFSHEANIYCQILSQVELFNMVEIMNEGKAPRVFGTLVPFQRQVPVAPPPQLNPLLLTQLENLPKSGYTPRSSSTSGLHAQQAKTEYSRGTSLPSFDIDEFISKFLQSSLVCSPDFSGSEINELEKSQLFRLVIAMRQCMSHEVLYRLKAGYNELKTSHKELTPTTPPEQLFFLLHSHLQFLRSIYSYQKESLRLIHNFESKMVPIFSLPPGERQACKQKYFQDTILTIDGISYSGTFIPMHPII